MKNFDQKGIAPLIIVLLVAVIGVVGFAAYTVGKNSSDKKDATTTENTQATPQENGTAEDDRFGAGKYEGTIAYINKDFGYKISVSSRSDLVSESNDKSVVVLNSSGRKVEIYASKATGSTLESCKTEKISEILSTPGYVLDDYVQRQEINYIPTLKYFTTKPGKTTVGDKTELMKTILVASTLYKGNCYNVVDYDLSGADSNSLTDTSDGSMGNLEFLN